MQRTDLVLHPALAQALLAPSLPQHVLGQEHRRRRVVVARRMPPVCILDSDADIVRLLRTTRGAAWSEHWACYHTTMWEWQDGAGLVGIIGGAVGGSFAVWVAEQLFASGCELLIRLRQASANEVASSGRAGRFANRLVCWRRTLSRPGALNRLIGH